MSERKRFPILRCTQCGHKDELIQGIFAQCPKCNGKLEFVMWSDIRILVIPDPDEWVQGDRKPYVVEIKGNEKIDQFSDNALSMEGTDLREWLRVNGTQLLSDVPLKSIDYTVCMW